MKNRPYYREFWRVFDAQKPLVMITGPRQAGKTVLAQAIAGEHRPSIYLNYDIAADKAMLAENSTFFERVDRRQGQRPLVVLDEIHKYKDWKNYLKGVYDGFSTEFRFLVTGSGRLDLFHQRGDALAGRYLQFRLFPFTLGELFAARIRTEIPGGELFEAQEPSATGMLRTLELLMHCSGFPEPFLLGRETAYRRWANSYHRQILQSDLRDTFAVRDIAAVETLYTLLIPRVGSSLAIAQLTDPLKTSHKTVSSWISVFERLYLVFRVRPYSRRINRSILKEPKLYFYDYAHVRDEPKRFENLVAVELKRAVSNWTDYGLGDFDLFYLRNKEREEVDFLVALNGNPLFLVEVKSGETEPAPSLRKFQSMLHVPAVQLVRADGTNRVFRNGPDKILITNAAPWLGRLG